MKRLYTIQIIPEGSTKIQTYRVQRGWIKFFVFFVILVVGLFLLAIWRLSDINMRIASFESCKLDNEWLKERHAEYEVAITNLDSIYVIENQIQNILQTYLESDSNKIRSILDKNRLKHVSSGKVKQDTDYEAEAKLNSGNLREFPNMLPVMGGYISKHYSEEHRGVDFAAAMNEPVFATANGKVISAGDRGNLGLLVELSHNGITTRYAHLSRISVKEKGYVKKGEIIGFVGSTGNSNGAHLHYEILINNKPINPELYF